MTDDERLVALERLAREYGQVRKTGKADQGWRLHKALSYWLFQTSQADRAVVKGRARKSLTPDQNAARSGPALERRDDVLAQLNQARKNADEYLTTTQ